MAKLHSYYGLCPIIDQHSLLGISNDYDSGHATVTLGKNIGIKYRVSRFIYIEEITSKLFYTCNRFQIKSKFEVGELKINTVHQSYTM